MATQSSTHAGIYGGGSSHNVAIDRGHIQVENTYYQYQGESQDVFQLLKTCYSEGAAYDSANSSYAPRCHPGTREAVQDDILGWISGPSISSPGDKRSPEKLRLLHLSGPAGAGKTAIARSLAETCQTNGWLSANFFFSSSSLRLDTSSKNYLIPTLAFQLSTHDSLLSYKDELLRSLRSNPTIPKKRLKEQTEFLLLRPFQKIRSSLDQATSPRILGVIIIDGLDEVRANVGDIRAGDGASLQAEQRVLDAGDQEEILFALLDMALNESFPFRILVVSRPEDVIENFFSRAQAVDVTRRITLDEDYKPSADIRKLLNDEFTDIRHQYRLPAGWPSQDSINWIVDRASGQFIFPATIVRFIRTTAAKDASMSPISLLKEVFVLSPRLVPTESKLKPYEFLDSLYEGIIVRAVPDPRLAVTWIGSIREYGMGCPAYFWGAFLETETGQSAGIFNKFLSLIKVPPVNDRETPFAFYHKSLQDYLTDSSRCGDLYVERAKIASFCMDRYLAILEGPHEPYPGFRREFRYHIGLPFSQRLVEIKGNE